MKPMKPMKNKQNEVHPSLKGYIPSEPIPEGYKLDRLFSNNGLEEFAIEFLVPIEKEEAEEKAA